MGRSNYQKSKIGQEIMRKRILTGAYLMVTESLTIRKVAKELNISKSTVHKDMTERLPLINSIMFSKVRHTLDVNMAERTLRGGLATQRKYKEMMKDGIKL